MIGPDEMVLNLNQQRAIGALIKRGAGGGGGGASVLDFEAMRRELAVIKALTARQERFMRLQFPQLLATAMQAAVAADRTGRR